MRKRFRIDNDSFADDFDLFLTSIESENIINKIQTAFSNLKPGSRLGELLLLLKQIKKKNLKLSYRKLGSII
ncbi:MAG: hypothetical protein IPJ22_08145 [Bacteroidetes bacterium]|nr:hypothetical protein [Bacteroidota bacterium]